MSSIIRHVSATPVRVPARPDSINSEGIIDNNPTYTAMFKLGQSFQEFVLEPKWIVQATTDDGLVGLGETYRGATSHSVHVLLQQLAGMDVLRLDWRRLPFTDPRVYDAGEAAILDLAGRTLNLPVHQLLGGAARDRVECSSWTGRRTPADAARKAFDAMQRGYRVFKFKCSDDDCVREWFARIRECCGERIRVILDPNQRWRDVATTLRMMEGVPREMIYGLEDPVDRQSYAAFRELREKLGVPVFLHIAVPYLHQGQQARDIIPALRERSADGFNFNGPMTAFVRLAAIAELEGLPCWHGSEVDLGILEAAALHACSVAPNCTIPCDIFGEMVREDDLIQPGLQFDGPWARVPMGPGLGVQLDQAALTRYQCGERIEVAI